MSSGSFAAGRKGAVLPVLGLAAVRRGRGGLLVVPGHGLSLGRAPAARETYATLPQAAPPDVEVPAAASDTAWMAANDDERRSLADAAGRAALFPARAAARVWRGPLEEAADEVLSAPEIARVLDRALAGSLPEDIARSLVRHRVLERIAAELAASGELERLVTASTRKPQTLELTDKVLTSDETQRALRHIASSPELRDAVARQTKGLTEEVVSGVRASAARLDDRAEQIVRRPPRAARPIYGGIATRALALAIDAGLTLVLFMSVVGVAALDSVARRRPAPRVARRRPARVRLDARGGHLFRPLLERGRADTGDAAAEHPRARPRGRNPLDRSITGAPGRARARDRADVRRLRAGAVHRRRRGLPDWLAGTVVLYDDARA